MPDAPRVGIVVVSHSRALADAAVLLARDMISGQQLSIAVAAGLDATTLGTDAVQIAAAMKQVETGAGVVVLMDLGSAVLSAEMAMELLADPAAAERVVLCPAPIVEGLIAAVVAAAGGADRREVADEAEAALDGKRSQLAPAESAAPDPVADLSATALTGRFTIHNPHGLHARPAARLVAEVRPLDADTHVRNLSVGTGPASAGSLSQLATLGAAVGHELEVSASGPAARQAIQAVLALAATGFGEDAATFTASPISRSGPLGASPGIGIGPARQLRPAAIVLPDGPAGTPEQEERRLDTAINVVRGHLEHLTSSPASADAAGIFQAHLMMLDDPELLAAAGREMTAGAGAESAWEAAIAAAEGALAALDDEYLRARSADVRAVGNQVLRAMAGQSAAVVTGDGVLIARDLTPAETAQLDLDLVRGLVLAEGSPTSHAAILARGRGLPALVGAGPDVLDIADGTLVVLDGSTGVLLVDPAPEVLADYRRRASDLDTRGRDQLVSAGGAATTRDGTAVVVAANLGSLTDARNARAAGADAAGLVRTEFLFLGRDDPPSVEEQVEVYRSIAAAMDGRRVTFRTLDVGGDKPLPYLPMPAEDNPFLGVRGIRLALARPDLLRDQLLALCHVAGDHPIGIMFPMVSALEELLQARRVLADAAGGALPTGLEVGIMVEVPAVAFKVPVFLPHLDFLSIGTNDLTQYALAADRGNPAVSVLSDPLDPGVLALIGQVCAAARGRATVAVCGEAAADPVAAPVLLGLGVRELSVAPPAVPGVKAGVRELDLPACTRLAERVHSMPGPQDVRRAASESMAEQSA